MTHHDIVRSEPLRKETSFLTKAAAQPYYHALGAVVEDALLEHLVGLAVPFPKREWGQRFWVFVDYAS